MPLSADFYVLDDSDSFLCRILHEYKASIQAVIQRFKTLDPMYDHDDLEQEAFFGVRLATLYWEEARAINMKFRTYLTWHISRHFQGKFRGDDKIVDIVDSENRVLVTIPYAKYKKKGRAIAGTKGYSTKIRSLLVYYDDHGSNTEEPPVIPHVRSGPIHMEGDEIVDVYNQHDDLIITIPRRSYQRMSDLILQQGFRTESYSIYEPPPRRPQQEIEARAALKDLALQAKRESLRTPPGLYSTKKDQASVVDIYTRRRDWLMRLSPERYADAKPYVDLIGGIAKCHTLATYPEPPLYDDLVHTRSLRPSVSPCEAMTTA